MRITSELHDLITSFMSSFGIGESAKALNVSVDQLADLAAGEAPAGVNLKVNRIKNLENH